MDAPRFGIVRCAGALKTKSNGEFLGAMSNGKG